MTTNPFTYGNPISAPARFFGRKAEVEQAVGAAYEAWRDWSEMDWEARASVLLRAAELLAGPWRDTLNAAAMLLRRTSAPCC